MKFLAIFSLQLVIFLVSAYNLRERGNDALQQQLSMPGMEKKEPEYYPRIIGGEEAAPNKFSYQVALISKDLRKKLVCGGSLISNQWVLTAAQCTNKFDSLTVQLGMLAFNLPAVEHDVDQSNFFRHERYDGGTKADIALIKIPPVKYTTAIQKIDLPRNFQHYVGTTAIASGWGFTFQGKPVAPSLRYVTLHIISNLECQKHYAAGVITSAKMCTGYGHSGVCTGDIGGPLVSTKTGTLIGIASLGCGFPDGFTRVDFYLDWIKNTTIVNA